MGKVFISHSTTDKYFVDLLVALLEFHHIENWCSSSSLQAGTKFPQEIENALENAETLIVVVSKNSSKSKWVTKEVAFFKAKKPDAKVVPIILDSLNFADAVYELKDYQAIDFTQSMLTGFEDLFELFDEKFLPKSERRKGLDKRAQIERRSKDDRRKSNLVQRLRVGFWKSYTLATQMGKSDELHLGVNELFKTKDVLKTEVAKYEYFDRQKGNPYDGEYVLEKSAGTVWEFFRDKVNVKAIYIIEAIAEDICKNYEIKLIEHRQISIRRESIDRRKKNPK